MSKKLPLPENETERLEALKRFGILDTPAEEAFDELTALAAHICQTPIALVSLVDESRQWFKSHHGLDTRQTAREVAFCAHIVSSGQMMEVTNALEDERFSTNPLVTGPPDIRFYIGAPLTTPDGHTLGTLCAVDRRPRELSEAQRDMLSLLARQVMRLIEQRTHAQALHRQKALFEAIFEGLPDAALLADTDRRIVMVNPAMGSIFGYKPEAVIGRQTLMLYESPEEYARQGRLRFNLSAEASIKPYEVNYRRANGEVFPGETVGTAIRDPEGKTLGFLGCIRDITERKRLERLKEEFVSVVSHELRTPLTSIRGSLGLITGGVVGELPEEANQLVEIAHDNSQRLLLLVNDILDLQRLESGGMTFNLEYLELRQAVVRSLEANRGYARKYGVRYTLDAAPEPLYVLADRTRLSQVLANLLSNAAKFSPEGGSVEVGVSRTDEGMIRATVRDHGPGVPESFRESLFDKFTQADASDRRDKGGTGLGLSICKAIIDHLGGQIGCESADGQGAIFYFDLPEQAPR